MRFRLALVAILMSGLLGPHIDPTSGLSTASKTGPQISISTWSGCRVNAYRDAVLATSPQAYLRMTPTGTREPSLGSVTTAWKWAAAPASSAGALGCDPNPAAVISASAWLSSEHAVFVAGDTVTYSYALWFKAAAGSQGVLFSSAAGLLSSGAGSRADRVLWIAPSGVLAAAVTDGPVTKWITSAAAVTDSTWHLAVVTMQTADSGATRGTRLYLDGVQVAFESQMRKGLPPTATESWRAGPAAVASAVGTLAPTTAFTGPVDEIAVWDKLLTDAQISSFWSTRNG